MIIEAKLKQWGNSFGIVIPKEIIKENQFDTGDTIKVEIMRRRMDGFGMFPELGKFEEEDLVHEEL
ncbi:AbrB/MazE/SpoVT family DNA-binding domain-containing protein [Candidatus Woesearchaeota archaeon]|nr:AbrB/MazE/SpoVT family DNA-binding domain-containing protein [Candidatus Woesearchaeota archaeon]